MCFSANASFLAAGAIGVVGVATVAQVKEPRSLLFASFPLMFAVHQFIEGLVWLGLEGRAGPLTLEHATFLFMLYAFGVLPVLMPAGVALMEPPGSNRRAILALTAVGAIVFAWHAYGVVVYSSEARIDHHSIAYRNPMTASVWLTGLYILATCGALLMSTHRMIRRFGAANVIGLSLVYFVKVYAFASVWCFYAAVFSMMIYWQFNRGAFDRLLAIGAGDSLISRLLPGRG